MKDLVEQDTVFCGLFYLSQAKAPKTCTGICVHSVTFRDMIPMGDKTFLHFVSGGGNNLSLKQKG